MSYQAIKDLVGYALRTGLIDEYDRPWAVNELLKAMGMDAWEEPAETHERPLEDILKELLDYAAARGRIEDDTTNRDLFDTELMGRLTPRPSQVISEFRRRYQADPKDATDWFYRFSQDTDYIRRYRIARDVKWKAATPYGELDITINLSKPERTPRPSRRQRRHLRPVIPSASFAGKTRATRDGSTIPPGRTTGSSPLPSIRRTGSSSTAPTSTITSTASF